MSALSEKATLEMDAMATQPGQRTFIYHVGLGSNLNHPVERLSEAIAAIAALPGVTLQAQSSWYASAPIGFLDQPDFVNGVAKISCDHAPQVLLSTFLDIERRQGRVRGVPNGPRTLDLDVLLWSGGSFSDADLMLPHPRLHQRAFVLHPLLEVSPEIAIPGLGAASAFRTGVCDQTIRMVTSALTPSAARGSGA